MRQPDGWHYLRRKRLFFLLYKGRDTVYRVPAFFLQQGKVAVIKSTQELGLLVNVNLIKNGIERVVNGL